MPIGELSPSRNAVRVSGTPSPSASRRSVMRLALGTAEPALLIACFMNQALTPLGFRGGPADSATSTSPFGSTYTQRGWSSPFANGATCVPAAATGFTPSGQPLAGAMRTVGIGDFVGSGREGSGPVPAWNGSLAIAPQPARASAIHRTTGLETRILEAMATLPCWSSTL